MLSKKLVGTGIGALIMASAINAPAAAQTSNECVAYSIQVCTTWEDYGYSSLKECRLQEYDNCMAGAPPQPGPAAAMKNDIVVKEPTNA